MTPLDELLATDWTPYLAVAGLIATVLLTALTIRSHHRTDTPSRSDQHIPAPESDLLGECWMDPIRPYFNRRVAADHRTARAINRTCFPEKQPHAVGAAGALTAKEIDRGRIDQ